MEKDWLIRTHLNKILGPVTKSKIIELIENNSLKENDEICSANGYWFKVKEKDLLDRFIYGDEKQGFNPVSEAKDVLTEACELTQEDFQVEVAHADEEATEKASDVTLVATDIKDLLSEKEDTNKETQQPEQVADIKTDEVAESEGEKDEEPTEFPHEDDLEYPGEESIEVPPTSEDLEYPDENNIDVSPKDEDLEYPDVGTENLSVEKTGAATEEDLGQQNVQRVEEVQERRTRDRRGLDRRQGDRRKLGERRRGDRRQISIKREVRSADKMEEETSEVERENRKRSSIRNDRYLLYFLALIIFIVLLVLFYYRKILLKSYTDSKDKQTTEVIIEKVKQNE